MTQTSTTAPTRSVLGTASLSTDSGTSVRARDPAAPSAPRGTISPAPTARVSVAPDGSGVSADR